MRTSAILCGLLAVATTAMAVPAQAMPADVKEAALEAKLSGRLAYLQAGKAWIHALHNRSVELPKSTGAISVSISPTDGAVLYFVTKPGTKPEDGQVLGYASHSPYEVAAPLPEPFDAQQ